MPKKTPPTQSPPRRALTLDVEKYQRMLDAPDMDDAKKKKLIEALWLLVVSFVDLGFEVRPSDSCGKDALDTFPSSQMQGTVLKSDHSPTSAVFAAAANDPATKQEAS